MTAPTIAVAKGVCFHLAEIHGHVTGHVHTDNGAVVVFGRAWAKDEPNEMHPGQMVAITLRYSHDYVFGHGEYHEVESWRWIDEAKFDQIVGMSEIRMAMGWQSIPQK